MSWMGWRPPLPRFRPSLSLPLLLAALLAAVPGCAVNERREIALYRRVLDGERPPRVDYRPGEPLTLPIALLLANLSSERLAIQGENYVQALIDKQRAASSFFPTVSFAPSYSRTDSSTDAGNIRVQGSGTTDVTALRGTAFATGNDTFDAPANLNWNLFRGFRDVATLGRTRAEIRRNRALLLDLQATVLLDVARAYYQVLRAERSVDVLTVSARTQNARVGEMRMKDVVGAAQKLDVAQIEAQAAGTRASLIAARSDVRNGRILLAYLISAPAANAPLVDKLDVPAAPAAAERFVDLAMRSRLDLRAAEAGIESARQNVQVAFGQYYPSISLNVNYYLQRQSPPTDSEWNALISTNLPIFTAGRINADYRTALSQLRQAKLQESGLRRQIEQDVLTAYENLTASTRRLEELRIEVEAAQTALDVAEGRYRAGLGTYLERLIAQDRQLSAQLDYTNEEFTRKILYLNLLRTGGQLQRPSDPLVLALPPAVTAAGGATPSTGPSEPPELARPPMPATLPAPVLGPTGTIGTGTAPETAPAAGPATQPATAPGP